MGLFAIASVVGFVLYRIWQIQSQKDKNADIIVGSIAIAILVIFFLVWAWLVEGANSPSLMLDRLVHGAVARFIFGLVLGAGVASVIEFSPLGRTGDTKQPPAGSAKKTGPEEKKSESVVDKSAHGIVGTSVLLSLALAIVFLGLASPHLDGWLRRVTSVKTSLIELQLGSVATHKISVTEGEEAFANARSLELLTNYNRSMRLDIEYYERYEKSDKKSARELLTVFDGLISPLTKCLRTALKNGLSHESARQKLRPVADNLTIILLVDAKVIPAADPVDKVKIAQNARHKQFWNDLKAIPEFLKDYLGAETEEEKNKGYMDKQECMGLVSKYEEETKLISERIAYPDVRNYRDLSPLYVAAVHFMTFLRSGDAALRILQKVERRQGFSKDYSFLLAAAQLSYYLGKPIDIYDSYLGYLEQMRTTARKRQDAIARSGQPCAIAKCAEKYRELISALEKRERRAELLAMNSGAYYIAEDLARGVKSAASYQAKAKEYAEELHKAAQGKDYPNDKNAYLDTYAYVILVLEVRKTNPDNEKIRRMAEILELVVETLEGELKQPTVTDRLDLTQLRIARAHLASARELAGQ